MKILGVCFAQSQSLICVVLTRNPDEGVKINFNREYEANKDNRGNVLICTTLTTDVNNDSALIILALQ